jgi:pimeloyl-ACP methyl ester carboxylesterase
MRSFTRDGLVFDVSDDGPAEGRVVIALHGFPEDRFCWRPLTEPLVGAGHRVLAPDQRGYSPGARPRGRRAYALAELCADVLALADTAGAARFDLVGHDWGAVVAWAVAGRRPERVRTLTALSVPHPTAVRDAALRSTQVLHSCYMLAFQLPVVPEAAMRWAGAGRCAAGLERDGLDRDSARRYGTRLADPAELGGPLSWYRALTVSAREAVAPARAPTLYVWGDRDHYISRYAVDRCTRYVDAPYRCQVLPGASHWLPTTEAGAVAPLLLDHLAANPD